MRTLQSFGSLLAKPAPPRFLPSCPGGAHNGAEGDERPLGIAALSRRWSNVASSDQRPKCIGLEDLGQEVGQLVLGPDLFKTSPAVVTQLLVHSVQRGMRPAQILSLIHI